jgi:hypothetical protein
MAIRAYSAAEHVRLCTVALMAGRTFLGSAFFVADGTLVTCAHVLRRAREDVTVVWSDRALAARVLVRDPPQPGDDTGVCHCGVRPGVPNSASRCSSRAATASSGE